MLAVNKAMKKNRIYIIISISLIVLIAILIGFASYVYSLMPSQNEIWNKNNRRMLSEWISPDSIYKIGLYHYDEGAFGFTCRNLSIVPTSDEYPIQGNILMTDSPVHVKWISKTIVQINITTIKNDFKKIKAHKYKEIIFQIINS